MTFTEIVDQHADFAGWQEAHSTGIGASEMATVLGLNPWKTRLQLWAEKTGRVAPPEFTSEAAEWGLTLEPIVAKKWAEKTGRQCEMAGKLLRSDEYPWAICTPDYWTMDDDGNWAIPVQIKTTSVYNLKDWAEGPPEHVRIQVHAEMLVTGAPWASVGVLVGGQKFMWADVERDEVLITQIELLGALFWKLIEGDEWPDPVAEDGKLINELHPNAIPGVEILLPEEALDWDADLTDAKAQIKHFTAIKEAKEAALKLSLGDATVGMLPGTDAFFTFKDQHRDSYVAKASDFRVLRRSTL